MKKIIDNKIYDTNTAETITTWNNGYPEGNFKYCSQTLYRTKGGRWFLYGEGGAMSIYATHCGSMYSGGKDIYSLTDGEAFEWLSERNFPEVAEQYFADRIAKA